ncbi:MAG: hypothetical protein KDA99_22900, partial [Planctomycetales bacterium]|nr:hypothetical protein [Planctomycetales bacterium]
MKPKDNPFRAQRIDSVRYRFLDSDWDFVRLRLHQLAYHAAIVGPEGSGKTTLQLELAEHLRQQGRTICWLRLRRDNRPQHALLVTQFVDA